MVKSASGSPLYISSWHNRLVHANEELLKKLHRNAKEFPKLGGKLPVCHLCSLGKATSKSFKNHFKLVSFGVELVHSDLSGPFPPSIDGARYMCTFIDQYSRFTYATGLINKVDAVAASEKYKELVHAAKCLPKVVERFHPYVGRDCENVSALENTTTSPHTPQHNPFLKRLNQTFLHPILTILEHAQLSSRYWEYAQNYVFYIKNRLPNRGLGLSPYERPTSEKPCLRRARVFGCSVFVCNHEPNSKIHSKAVPGIMLVYNDYSKYKVECMPNKKTINSEYATFDENSFPGLEKDESSSLG